jgi:phosphopentomutase
VARVIARPFTGTGPGDYHRTYNRHDYSMLPTGPTLLDWLQDANVPVIGVGKISDIFAGVGVNRSIQTKGNADGMAQLLRLVREEVGPAFVFVNLIDFDMNFGHRRDPVGYANALVECDGQLRPVLDALGPDDLLLLTADHGCDPTYLATTDHTREAVPLLAYRPGVPGVALGVRQSFADLAATVAEALGCAPATFGSSFLAEMHGGKR